MQSYLQQIVVDGSTHFEETWMRPRHQHAACVPTDIAID